MVKDIGDFWGLDGYEVAGEDERCCVVVLARKDGVKLKIERV